MDSKQFITTMTMLALCTAVFALLFTPNVLGIKDVSSLGVLDQSISRRTSSKVIDKLVDSATSNPFAPLNDKCRHDCAGDAALTPESKTLLSSCPQRGPEYENQHCNSCCDQGASSLHLR